jgi:hypothetical protein
MWPNNSGLEKKRLSQNEQLNILSSEFPPECDLKCLFNPSFEKNVLRQFEQECLFSLR